MEKFTLGTLVDQAKTEKLNRRQRRRVERWQRAMERRGKEAAIYDELESELCTCHVAAVAMEARQAFAMQCDCEADVVEFGIDPENLSAWLEVIADFLINKLPKILEVLLPLFITLALALCALSPTTVHAQHVGCEGRIHDTKNLPLWKPPAQTAEMTKSETEYAVRCSGELLPPETAEKPSPPRLVSTTTPKHVLAQLRDCPGGQCPLPAEASTPPPPMATRREVVLQPAQPVRNTVRVVAQPVRNTVRYVVERRPVRRAVGAPLRLVGASVRNKPVRRAIANFRTRRAARIVRRVGSRW